MNKRNKEAALNQVYSFNSMPQDIIYDFSDSEDETERGGYASIGGELDPELMSYIPSIKVKEDEIQEIVNRYISVECKSHIKSEVEDDDKSCSEEVKVSYDIYADPIPSCSHQYVEIPKVPNVPSNQVLSKSCQNVSRGTSTYPTSHHLHEEVHSDIYENPIPGCSRHYVDSQNEGPIIIRTESISPSSWYEENDKILANRKIKHEPDLEIEICCCTSAVCNAVGESCSSLVDKQILTERTIKNEPDLDFEIGSSSNTVCDAVGEQSSFLDDEQVPEPIPIKNTIEGSNDDLEMVAVTDTSENILLSNKPVVQSYEIKDNTLSNITTENDIEPSIFTEPLQSLIILYRNINGLHNDRIDITQESCIEFCARIVKIKSNHSILMNEIEKGNLIKFEQLVVWGRNLNRNAEDLIKEAKPDGCGLDEAQKFVFKVMRTEIRYRQRLADSNQSYIFGDTSHYKFHCMACDRREDNLTWLVAHLCRDTAEIIYMCCFCGFLFFNNACSLIYHVILDLLEGPKKEYCVECQGFFPSVANHLMDIGSSWKVSCDSCDFISLSQCSLSIHQRYHKMEKHHVCPECGGYFVFFNALEDHMRNVCYFNAKKIRHICPICAVIFKDKEILCRHLFSIHHQRWIKCIQCHMLLISRVQYISHRSQNHPESPCTYQICHTCTLCPGREFKSSGAQIHMKNHANDVINVIILYVCDCNYYTIHKNSFIEHKAQNCEPSPTFGKWDNSHEMKICGVCNDIKFVNLSKPFVCENCEVLNSPEPENSPLTKTYECKICKLFLIYRWEAVIEHFYCFHPNIAVHKFPNCVKSTSISGSNNDWISRSFDHINSSHIASNNRTQSFSSQNPRKTLSKIRRINNVSSNVIKQNVAKAQSVRKKGTTRNKCKANNVPFYNSLSHFMASHSATPSNQVKMQVQRKNIAMDINNISSLPPAINDISIRRLKQSVLIVDTSVPGGGDNILESNNEYCRPDPLSVDIQQTMQYVSSCETEKNEPKALSSNVLCGKSTVIEEAIVPNQSHVKYADNDIYGLIKTAEASDKTAFKDNIIYINQSIDPNNCDKTNNHLDRNLKNTSSEDLPKTDDEINLMKKILECKKCQYKCNEALELVKHFIDSHYIQNTYQCMECGACFANLKHKINHLKTMHKIDTKLYLEPDINRLDTCRSKFRCPVCLRGFLSDQDKNLHMRGHGMAYLQSIRSISKEM